MGLGYDFESDKEYNFENSIAMKIELGKTCFSPGEFVKGGIILEPKYGNAVQYLQNPNAFLSITENALYTYTTQEYNAGSNNRRYVTKTAKEKIPILNIPLDFSYYNNHNLNGQLKLPFSFQMPLRIYPSCFFGSNAYIKHFLTIEFPSISAKKSLIIVIKNPPYFNAYNHLYQSPAMVYREMKKNKFIFSQGGFAASLKIPKNAFRYDEEIPFEINIDLTRLTMDIRFIYIALKRDAHKNLQYDHSSSFRKETSEVALKTYALNKQQRVINIKDKIEINVDKNPKNTYYKLDNDNSKVSQKFNGIYIYPTCKGGLLSVEYFLKMTIIMDTFFSTNEEFEIPIDLYEPFADGSDMNYNYNYNQNITNSQRINYPNYPNYSQSPFMGNNFNSQVYYPPPQMSQILTPVQTNQSQGSAENNLPSEAEVMNKTPEDDVPAPPSVLNLNNKDFQ